MKGPTSRSNLTGKGKEPQLAPSKLEKYKLFLMGAQGKPIGVMITEYPRRPRTARERDMTVYEQHRVLRRSEGYRGIPRKPLTQYFCIYYREYGHSSDNYQGMRWGLRRIRREHPHL